MSEERLGIAETKASLSPPDERLGKRKYFILQLASERYGIPVSVIQDIIQLRKITPVPRWPEFVEGVINLRGHVIPVLDLRRRLGLPSRDYDERTCIVIVRMAGMPAGLIVDRVRAIVELSDEQIDPSPPNVSDVEAEFLVGLGREKDDVILLLNVERILRMKEALVLRKLTEEEA